MAQTQAGFYTHLGKVPFLKKIPGRVYNFMTSFDLYKAWFLKVQKTQPCPQRLTNVHTLKDPQTAPS